ncbi:lysoplasmalogenase TMEM86A-like [Tubulanus polymorphus]|uniref:lysoplasmalogenase TMEM86A-like n=1 Tax=Tubulanus polymorphus TaxID=672921 RepID=UPI003DA62574
MKGHSKLEYAAGLIPFFVSLLAYCVYCQPHVSRHSASVYAATFKCLPIVCLIAFVASVSDERPAQERRSSNKKYLILGLLFSCAGDACLVFKDSLFLCGMAMFAIALACYVNVFGFWISNAKLSMVHLIPPAVTFLCLYGSLSLLLMVACTVYTTVFFILGVSACHRLFYNPSLVNLAGYIGCWSFAISDFILAVDKWKMKIDSVTIFVMALYYVGQLLIAISFAGNCRRQVSDPSRQKRSN